MTQTVLYKVAFDDPDADYVLFLNNQGQWAKGVGNAREFAVRKEAVIVAEQAPFPRELVHVRRIVRTSKIPIF